MSRFPWTDMISLVGDAPRYDFAESVGPDLRLAELLDMSGDAGLQDLALSYRTAQGDARLRSMIAESHGVRPEEVVITVGGMHAIFLLAFILCDRGDEAVTTSPLFPLARNALETVGARVGTLALSFDQGYQPDLGELRALLSSKTKLVSLASPQNPSGVALSAETLQEILALMAQRCPEAYLLVDETYREAAYGQDSVAQSAIALGPRVISVASLSKCHGAPGLRLGWAITRDPVLREQLVLGKFSTVVSCSAIDEALALKVLEHQARIIAQRRAHLAEGLRRTEDWVRANRDFVEWVRPNAGALCCVRLKPSAFDEAAVARFYAALTEEGVRVANGKWFGGESRIFRWGFGLHSMPDLEAGLAATTRALRQSALAAA